MHFARLANTLLVLKDEESARGNNDFACDFDRFLPIKKIHLVKRLAVIEFQTIVVKGAVKCYYHPRSCLFDILYKMCRAIIQPMSRRTVDAAGTEAMHVMPFHIPYHSVNS